MGVESVQSRTNNKGIIWETPIHAEIRADEQRIYRGTLILDVDGTLTVPGHNYKIDTDALFVLGQFLQGGGNIDFCTGATRGRLERTVLTPFYNLLSELHDPASINELFKRVVLQPENGSALLLARGTRFVENEIAFDWYKIHELHVPDKDKLKTVLRNKVLPNYKRSYLVAEDYPFPQYRRDYMVSVKDVGDTRNFKAMMEREIARLNPQVDWGNIAIKAARTTVDFFHAESGKATSVPWLLQEVVGFSGPVYGFGDLGDEFASVVPTFNVNQQDPNAFRTRDQPAMDLTGGWELLEGNNYVVVGESINMKVLNRRSGREIPVLRDNDNRIIFAIEENGYLVPAPQDTDNPAHPVRIQPLSYQKDGKTIVVEDAGKGTAYMIDYLMRVGCFS